MVTALLDNQRRYAESVNAPTDLVEARSCNLKSGDGIAKVSVKASGDNEPSWIESVQALKKAFQS